MAPAAEATRSGLLALAPLRSEAAAVRSGAPAATVVRTGRGPQRSRLAAAVPAHLGTGAALAVLGVAGAVVDGLAAGDLVVADTVLSPDGRRLPLPTAGLLAGALRRAGLPARTGVIASAEAVAVGEQRRALAAAGALAVDTESAWLLGAAAGRPAAVVRAVVDTPERELRRPVTVAAGIRALSSLRRASSVVAEWAALAAPRTVYLAGPRSFCAGVERAIDIVERALALYGAPVYVRRQIVHNAHVVSRLEGLGAVFVPELGRVPDGATVVLSAHGVSPAVRNEAERRGLRVIDATCPLVAKVHAEARRFARQGRHVILVGHAGHDEVEGTLGEIPDAHLVASPEEVERLDLPADAPVAVLTQTTLAPDDVVGVVSAVRDRFADTARPAASDICYATENRQLAVRAVASEADVVLVVGSANSSNSNRLVEVAERCGTPAHLVEDEADIDLAWLDGAAAVGLSAGASTPDILVARVVDALSALGPVQLVERVVTEEAVHFALPGEVR